MTTPRLITTLILACALAATASAQFGQPNSAAARLVVNGIGAGNTPGPFPAILSSGPGALSLDFGGPPLMPFILFAGPANPGHANYGPIGIADIGTAPAYADVFPVLDGSQPGFPGILFALNAAGAAHFAFTLPPGLPAGPLINLQALILQPPGSPSDVVLTAAFYLYVI